MEIISVEQFREYYHLAEKEVSDSFLIGYIQKHGITEGELPKRNWAASAKALFSRGVTYGHNITSMIARDYRFADSEEDFGSVTHLIIRMDIFTYAGLSEPRYFVLDREENMLYYSNREIRLDYQQAEVAKSITDDVLSRILKQLRERITPQWEIPHGLRQQADYCWSLFLLLSKGDMIRYEGEGRDEEFRPGFHEWYQQLCEEIKNE